MKNKIDSYIAKNSKYSSVLQIVKKLKEEHGDCSCKNPKFEVGVMDTPAYRGIRFSQCGNCKAYKFPIKDLEYIFEQIDKEKNELFYLVEYCTDSGIEYKWLFRTKKEAENHIKKELYGEYNKKAERYDCQGEFYAKITTLMICE